MGFRFSPGCCCKATPGCAIASDEFNRMDNTNLGPGWNEQAEDWSIDTDQLKISAANAVVTWATPHSDTDVRVSVHVRANTAGDIARIVLNYTDNNNHYFAELKFGTSGGHLKIASRSGGTDTELASLPVSIGAGSFVAFTACLKNGALFANLGNVNALSVSRHGLSPSSGIYGLGTGGTVAGTIRFDHFQATDSDLAGCPQCTPPCHCIGDAPDEVVVVASGITNGTCTSCASLDGTYILQRCGHFIVDQCTWDLIIPGVCSPDAYNQVRVGLGVDNDPLPYYRFVSFRGAVLVDGVPTPCKFGGAFPLGVVFTNRSLSAQPCPSSTPETIVYLGDPAPTVCLGDSATVTLAAA